MPPRPLVLVALAGLLGGCAALEPPPPRELAGPTDGYSPTPTFLKVHVKREDGSVALLNFDRREWHVSEIARRLDRNQLEFVAAQAQPREILNEYLAQEVRAPEELRALRFDAMGATHEERRLLDAEWDALLRRHVPAHALPTTLP